MTSKPYSPSPRPTFSGPTLVRETEAVRHVWGDSEAGEVDDWIYVSSGLIHCIVFGLQPGRAFRHSPEFRTVFGADELLHVVEGTMVLANPETGEVQRVAAGGSVSFGPDTWHHAFAHGASPLRVLEFFAPPPSTGSSGPYARARPYLEVSDSSYLQSGLIERWPAARAEREAAATLRPVEEGAVLWTRHLEVLLGVMVSTPRLTAGRLELGPSDSSVAHSHDGDEVVYVLSGRLAVEGRAESGGEFRFEAGPGDLVYLPIGIGHRYLSTGGEAAAMVAVAPRMGP
jgi:quercetin dioxygenase-like cupin family protein